MTLMTNDQQILTKDTLFNQGVTTSKAQRPHLEFMRGTLTSNPNYDVTAYRVNSSNTQLTMMG